MATTSDDIRINAKRLEAAGAPSSDIEEYVSKAVQDLNSQAPEKSLAGKAWDALAIPEQKSREGLKMLADMVPSVEPGRPITYLPTFGNSGKPRTLPPNVTSDVIMNTPKIMADTLAETAPSFISRGSILTSGALKAASALAPVANSVGNFIGKTAESTSGLAYKTPGVLAETVKNPGLLVGDGLKSARELYSAVKDESAIRPTMKDPQSMMVFLKRAWNAVGNGGLTPDEALEARKAVDDVSDSLPDVVRKSVRSVFDNIAKTKFAEADKAYSQAVKSEALRTFWGMNKSGTPSLIKGGMTTMLPVTAPFFSPLVQGTAAAGVGLARKAVLPFIENPSLGILSRPVLDRTK